MTSTNTWQNRMMESLVLFDSVVNSRWFMRTSIILFLNKVDLFKQKLGRSPLVSYFPDYSGGNDVNRAAKYLLWRFNQVNRAHLNLYPQYVWPAFAVHSRDTQLTSQQSHTSNGYLEYSASVRRGKGDDSSKRPERLGYPMRPSTKLLAYIMPFRLTCFHC